MLPQIQFEAKGGQMKEVDPAGSVTKASSGYSTPEDGEEVGVKVTRQEKWRRKNKTKVAAYMRDYRAKQKQP